MQHASMQSLFGHVELPPWLVDSDGAGDGVGASKTPSGLTLVAREHSVGGRLDVHALIRRVRPKEASESTQSTTTITNRGSDASDTCTHLFPSALPETDALSDPPNPLADLCPTPTRCRGLGRAYLTRYVPQPRTTATTAIATFRSAVLSIKPRPALLRRVHAACPPPFMPPVTRHSPSPPNCPRQSP